MSTQDFLLIVNGQIEYAEYPGANNLSCQYKFIYGTDWEVVRVTGEGASLESGITQSAERAPGDRAIYTWNFPIEITFKSTNPYGWPKIVLSIVEQKGRGMLPVRGYGWIHIPVTPGRYQLNVRLFRPRSSSIFQEITSALWGKEPEFIKPEFVCEDKGREVTRVKSEGCVSIKLDIMTKNMTHFGFDQPVQKFTQVDLAKSPSLLGSFMESPISKQL
jgi:B9 domain-containing protein 1